VTFDWDFANRKFGKPLSAKYRRILQAITLKAHDENSLVIEYTKMAKKAQLTLSELILYTKVTLKNVDTEKYGRILADVYLEDIHVNNWMIENRLAVEYDGGTKKVPVSWLKYYITGSCD
jgi:hypothetical protein